MAVGYVIVAHHRPAQLLRLARTIRSGSAGPIVIHIDRRVRSAFAEVEGDLVALGDVMILAQTAVRWAHFSQVEAELAALAVMLERFPHVAHVQHLTGQCYPIRPLVEFEAAVGAGKGRSFLDCVDLPQPGFEALWQHVCRYHLLGPRRRVVALPWRRRLPIRRYVAGSPYWCLARDHARYLLQLPLAARHFYRGVLSPDEVFFQTELLNSPHRDEVVQAEWTWTDWQGDNPSPETLTMHHASALARASAFFARKFDETVDVAILDLIDAELGGVQA